MGVCVRRVYLNEVGLEKKDPVLIFSALTVFFSPFNGPSTLADAAPCDGALLNLDKMRNVYY